MGFIVRAVQEAHCYWWNLQHERCVLSLLSPLVLVVGETVEVLVGMVTGTSVAGGKIGWQQCYLMSISVFLVDKQYKSEDIEEEMSHPVGHLAELHVSLEGPKSKQAVHFHWMLCANTLRVRGSPDAPLVFCNYRSYSGGSWRHVRRKTQ